MEGLKHADEIVRKKSIEHIGMLQTTAAGIIEDLLPCLQDAAAAVRAACALALVRIDPHCTQAVHQLIPLLSDPEPEPRINAGIALGTIGPAAASAEAALRSMQNDPDQHIAAIATAALERIFSQGG